MYAGSEADEAEAAPMRVSSSAGSRAPSRAASVASGPLSRPASAKVRLLEMITTTFTVGIFVERIKILLYKI
jgi:hypothetical protein